MKKILLFSLMTLLNLVSAHAQSGEIVAYSTEIDGTASKQTPTIDKSNFVGLRGGDYFKVTISAASSATLSMKDAKYWDTFVSGQHPSNGVYTTVILTEKQASGIIENGLYIEIEKAKITQISFCHSDAVPFWDDSHNFGSSGGGFDISDNLKAFAGATTNDKIRFEGELEAAELHQLLSFHYLTGDGWVENAIFTESRDFSGNAGDKFVCYVDVTSSLISAINETSDATKIRAYRINGKGITLKKVELCTPLSLSESQNLACDAGDYITVHLTRSITAGKWSTIVLPFDLPSSQIETVFGAGASVAEFTGGDENTLNFTTTLTGSKMKANQPYAIKVASDFSSKTISNVTIVSAASPNPTQSVTNWNFVGNYTQDKTVPTGSYYFKDNALHKATSSEHSKINGFRGYFTYTGGSNPAPSLNIVLDGTITGIKNVTSNEESRNDKFFNLSGQQVSQPTKGIYIKNGKKYIIK